MGMKDIDRLTLAKRQLERKALEKRSTSSFPIAIKLLLSRPIVSAHMIARATWGLESNQRARRAGDNGQGLPCVGGVVDIFARILSRALKVVSRTSHDDETRTKSDRAVAYAARVPRHRSLSSGWLQHLEHTFRVARHKDRRWAHHPTYYRHHARRNSTTVVWQLTARMR